MKKFIWYLLVCLTIVTLVGAFILKSMTLTAVTILLCIWLKRRNHTIELPNIYQKKGIYK